MRNHQNSTVVRKGSWNGSSISTSNAARNFGETVTLSKSELRSLLDAAIGQNPSPAGYIDFYNDCAYDVKNDDGDESGYPASLEASPAPVRPLRDEREAAEPGRSPRKSNSVSNVSETSSSSKLEAKRRQWQKEKEELVEWDPWGRPGGGAPRQRSRSLNHVPVSRTTSSSLPYQKGGTSAAPSSIAMTTTNQRRREPSKYSLRSSVSSQRIPEYLKSSLPFGPSSANPSSNDNPELWSREEFARHSLRNESANDVWYDLPSHTSFSGPISPTQPSHPVSGSVRSHARGQGVFETDSNRAQKLAKAMEYRKFIEAQMEEKQRKQREEKERKRKEEEEEELRLEEERKRIQAQFEEEQRKIKEKEELEERKRQVLLEAVKNAQEAAEAEKRAKRAQKLNQGLRGNESYSSLKVASPAHSVISTNKMASASPTEEKLTPSLSMAGSYNSRHHSEDDHDVISAQELTSLQAWMKGEVKPSPESSPPQGGGAVRLQQMATVHPIQSQATQPPAHSPNSPSTCNNSINKVTKEFGIQTEPSLSPYIQNRLLTPSQWRIQERLTRLNQAMAPVNVWGSSRDMGTQTEYRATKTDAWHQVPSQQPPIVASRRKVDHSDYAANSSSSSCCSSAAAIERTSIRNPKPKTNHDEPHGGGGESDATTINAAHQSSNGEANKPKWGVNKPSKNFVKMTERDPNCRRRKKLQEMRKQHWEKELATQKALTQTKKMITASSSAATASKHNGGKAASHSSVNKLGTTYTISAGERRVPPVQGTNKDSAVLVLPPLSGRWSRSSDSLPNVVFREDQRRLGGGGGGGVDVGGNDTRTAPPDYHQGFRQHETRTTFFGEAPVRRKWHSQENFLPNTGTGSRSINYTTSNPEPPRRAEHFQYVNYPQNELDADADDAYDTSQVAPTPRRKWSEQGSFDLEKMTLLRAVLAANQDLDAALDFESNSHHYQSSPKNGETYLVNNVETTGGHALTKNNPPIIRRDSSQEDRDPLVNPNIIMERPTPRQDKILQQLSTLRRGLLLKQQEIESRLQQKTDLPNNNNNNMDL